MNLTDIINILREYHYYAAIISAIILIVLLLIILFFSALRKRAQKQQQQNKLILLKSTPQEFHQPAQKWKDQKELKLEQEYAHINSRIDAVDNAPEKHSQKKKWVKPEQVDVEKKMLEQELKMVQAKPFEHFLEQARRKTRTNPVLKDELQALNEKIEELDVEKSRTNYQEELHLHTFPRMTNEEKKRYESELDRINQLLADKDEKINIKERAENC